MSASSLKWLINGLGVVAFTAYCAIAILSYIQAPALWPPAFAPNATAFFSQLYGQENLNAMRAFFGGPLAVIISRWIPLIVASLAAMILVVFVGRSKHGRDDRIARRILTWSFAFAGVSFFAYPVYTQDFWLSAVWGDMIASGINPYYQKFTPEMLGALPLDHFPMTMSYGPLWALISAAVMWLSNGSILAAGLLFKAVLIAAWLGAILLVDRMMHRIAPESRSLALIIIGWVPLGVLETVAEGHNDIMLALPALLWFSMLLRKKLSAPIALAASALCKYTTAPLFILDVVHSLRAQRMTLGDYAYRLLFPICVSLAILAIFYRSSAFFDGILLVGSWHFMQPDDAFMAFSRIFGNWIEPFGYALTAIFPAIAIHQCINFWKTPNMEQMLRSAVAIMCAVSFSLISHLWPWYLVWTLPIAALIPRWWLSRFIIGLALFAPFTAVVWWVPEAEGFKNLAALLMYSAATLWVLATSRKDAEPASMRSAEVRQVNFSRAKEKVALFETARRLESRYQPEMRLQVKASGEN